MRGSVTIASIDVEKIMYPSMRFSLLSDAVKHFARILSRADRETAEVCLSMLRFGMDRHTYMCLQFAGRYYRCAGAGTANDPGLTIGGFESAWMADLGMSYLFKPVPGMFRHTDMFKISGYVQHAAIDLWSHLCCIEARISIPEARHCLGFRFDSHART